MSLLPYLLVFAILVCGAFITWNRPRTEVDHPAGGIRIRPENTYYTIKNISEAADLYLDIPVLNYWTVIAPGDSMTSSVWGSIIVVLSSDQPTAMVEISNPSLVGDGSNVLEVQPVDKRVRAGSEKLQLKMVDEITVRKSTDAFPFYSVRRGNGV